ncbi:actin-like protein arp-6 [Colletotrichum higginsianum]|nr:actin-like protein arp-6 [Colletotrichum higginsianum]
MVGGRKSKSAGPAPPSRTLVLDNGGYTIKAGFVSEELTDEPRVIPNCIARDRARKVYVASDVEKCRDFGEIQFRRPVEKGFIVNWEAQKEIWDHEFFDDSAPQKCDPSETRLLLAEQPNSLPVLQSNCDQIVFEEYQFASYYRGIGASFNAYHDVQGILQTPRDPNTTPDLPAEVVLLIDSGYSNTIVMPLLNGRPLHSAGTRGEKREQYVTGAGVAKDYVLPDFHTRTKGIVRDYDPAMHTKARKMAARAADNDEDILTLRNERFSVPELLFQPSDIGLRQPGLADVIMQSLSELPIGLWPGLLANIVVVGGNALFPGFIQRLEKELVKRVPDACIVRVAHPVNPITSTWEGGANLAKHPDIHKFSVTKQEYEEYGAAWVARKFGSGTAGD